MSTARIPAPKATRFVVLLIAALAGLTWGAWQVVTRTARHWFERDVALRAELAANGSRRALAQAWRGHDWSEMQALLTDLARDERIMGAAICGADLRPVARTGDYPSSFACEALAPRLQNPDATAATSALERWHPWSAVEALPGGRVFLSAVPLVDGEEVLGFLALVHDLSFADRRETKTQLFLLLAFAVLSAAAAAVTVVAARVAWRGWNNELRGLLLRGASPRPEFQPLLQDVRELVERLVLESDSAGEGAPWSPTKLKHIIGRHLGGNRVVVLANREPYLHERGADGTVQVRQPASGLVTALEPVLRATAGVWVAHGSGNADREHADADGRLRVPPGEGTYGLRRVWLSPEEEKGYYEGFANEGLWPLCHLAHARPVFRAEDWKHYRAVNQRFVDAVCAEVDSEEPVILVQDYHFALAPRMLRERLPHATILSFWHIPWPNAEHFGICPWREELLEGMLGSSIVGFHIPLHCNNFLDAVERYMEARIDREDNAVVLGGRRSLIRPYPISIEWPPRQVRTGATAEHRASVRAELGLGPDARIGVGVDRLDYTKGIEERLLAVERLLERFPAQRGRFTFVQLAAPSRTVIERYRRLGERVEALVKRINERFGTPGGYRPVILLRAHHDAQTVFRYYAAADLCYVSSLHDGMNLVAKEFVAARDDERGVLLLSQFTGAARELTEALIVNPYDLEEASSALAAALEMPVVEQEERMRAMRSYLTEFNVYRWAGRMLVDAARLRSREQVSRRVTTLLPSGRPAEDAA